MLLAATQASLGGFRERQLVLVAQATVLSGRKDDADIALLDEAYWKKGCS
jgi:hypothetical protein